MIDVEKSLYGKTQVTFPILKLYVVFVGVEDSKGKSILVIADELEESVEKIENIIKENKLQ